MVIAPSVIRNQQVAGSNPAGGSNRIKYLEVSADRLTRACRGYVDARTGVCPCTLAELLLNGIQQVARSIRVSSTSKIKTFLQSLSIDGGLKVAYRWLAGRGGPRDT
jgi:hypothetical protein